MAAIKDAAANILNSVKGNIESAELELRDEQPDYNKIMRDLSKAEDDLADVTTELREISSNALIAALSTESDRL